MSIHLSRESVRRLVHFGFGSGAFLLVWIGRRGGLVLAVAALVYNVWLAPWLGFDVAYRRPGEGRFGGLVSYPLAVLLLLLLAPLEVAAGGWIVMATVDPIAAAVGSRWPRPRVPFHRRKSMVGTVAGFLGGWVGASLLLAWMNVPHAPVAGACAAAAGALAEVLPLPVDDNLPVAAAASLALLPWIL